MPRTAKRTPNYTKEIQEFRDDIREYLKTYARTFCGVAADELTRVAKSAMADFYNDYSPKVYQRTFDLRDNSYKRYFRDNGRRVYGGVRISAENMQPYGNIWTGRLVDPEIIVNSAWEHGWHGRGDIGIPPMSPTPLEIVRERMFDDKFISDLNDVATKAANSNTYKHLPV